LLKPPTFHDIVQARQRIAPYAHSTPVLTATSLNQLVGAHLFFKCENFQKTGSFKFRGACNATFAMPSEKIATGIATHSSGNHGAAVSLAAHLRSVPAYIVMPNNAPLVKVNAVKAYHGHIRFCQPTLTARETTLEAVVRETHATFIHPYNNPLVIAGQGTVALEFLEQVPKLDMLIAPVGGGGLMSGISIAARHLHPSIVLVGAEPQNADDARRSLESGQLIAPENPDTIADGLRTALSPLTFHILHKNQVRILTASEENIVHAMRLIWERLKIVVEASAVVPLAVILQHQNFFHNKKIGIVLSGGNTDLDKLPWCGLT